MIRRRFGIWEEMGAMGKGCFGNCVKGRRLGLLTVEREEAAMALGETGSEDCVCVYVGFKI